MGSVSRTPPNFSVGGAGYLPFQRAPLDFDNNIVTCSGKPNEQDSGGGVRGGRRHTSLPCIHIQFVGRAFQFVGRAFSVVSPPVDSLREEDKKRDKEKLTHARGRACINP